MHSEVAVWSAKEVENVTERKKQERQLAELELHKKLIAFIKFAQ